MGPKRLYDKLKEKTPILLYSSIIALSSFFLIDLIRLKIERDRSSYNLEQNMEILSYNTKQIIKRSEEIHKEIDEDIKRLEDSINQFSQYLNLIIP